MTLLNRLPSHVINGIAAAVGIGLIQLLIGGAAGAHAAQLALSGAVCASLADQPLPASRTRYRVSAAAVLSVLAALLVEASKPFPVGMSLSIALIAFVAMMAQAWGPRAGTVSFAPIVAIVFVLAAPAGPATLVATIGWHAAGAAAYLAWSLLSAAALAPRYRRLALAEALSAAAALLRARAALTEAPVDDPGAATALRDWVMQEATLADRLQVARDFVFADALTTNRPAAMLLATIDLRDVLLASRMDLESLEGDAEGRWLLAQTATALRYTACRIDFAAMTLVRGGTAVAGTALDVEDLYADPPIRGDDPHSRLLAALVVRMRSLDAIALRIVSLTQPQQAQETLPLTAAQLRRFIAPEGWPLQALLAQRRWNSPVLRHALRMAMALSIAYLIGLWVPWASHPHWLMLSVAVVLRGNLEQTLSRRNARVLGTLFGCAVVLPISALHAPTVLAVVFLLAVATAHAFLNRRYWLTATAATVMALLQAHAVDPAAGFALAERAADTVFGALLAWGFSYVLPSWERRQLPTLLRETLREVNDYAMHALQWPAVDSVEPRLARRRAYDALGNLAAALQRSRSEPARVQVPVAAVTTMLDHAQRLMADLAIVRMITTRSDAPVDAEAFAQVLRTARQSLAVSFDLSQTLATPLTPLPPRHPVGAAALQALPAAAPDADLLPWLQHRLQTLIGDAQRARIATDTVLRTLASAHAAAQSRLPSSKDGANPHSN